MREALSFLASRHELLFYDQLGCGQQQVFDGRLTLDTAAGQLAEVISDIADKPLSILAHSWGALVLAAAASAPASRDLIDDCISSGLLVNPVPFSRVQFDESAKAFVDRIPFSTRLYVLAVGYFSGDGATIMRTILRYYRGDRADSEMRPPDFNLSTYTKVMESLGDFDYSPLPDISKRMNVLLASHDATNPEMIRELVENCRKFEIIKDVGHFPLQEKPKTWIQAIERLIDPN